METAGETWVETQKRGGQGAGKRGNGGTATQQEKGRGEEGR